MERKNPKQLRLKPDLATLAEEVHRSYQSAFKTSISFQAFGNMVMREGLNSVVIGMAVATKNKQEHKRKKRRRING